MTRAGQRGAERSQWDERPEFLAPSYSRSRLRKRPIGSILHEPAFHPDRLPGGEVQHAPRFHRARHRPLKDKVGLLARGVTPRDPGSLDLAQVFERVLLHSGRRLAVGNVEPLVPCCGLLSIAIVQNAVGHVAGLLDAGGRPDSDAAGRGAPRRFGGGGESPFRSRLLFKLVRRAWTAFLVVRGQVGARFQRREAFRRRLVGQSRRGMHRDCDQSGGQQRQTRAQVRSHPKFPIARNRSIIALTWSGTSS